MTSTLARAYLIPLLERERNTRGTLATLASVALLSAAAATLQIRVQRHELMSAELWSLQPIGADPAAFVAGWMVVVLAFRVAVSRTDADRESGWLPVLHAEGHAAWRYAIAVWSLAVLLATLTIVIAYAAMTPEEAAAHRPRVVLVDKNNDPREVMDLDGTPISEPHLSGVTNATT